MNLPTAVVRRPRPFRMPYRVLYTVAYAAALGSALMSWIIIGPVAGSLAAPAFGILALSLEDHVNGRR